ncbi:activator-dependent family glycosyltransferase [Actinomadura rudentiformis]|uniref:Activator-dependent family glycosyltransferase n=1 Tax=Actinomadura rudentiformis TaxID=359158 RepID=A0A6H9YVG6_9ACTN|nr:activator-dependent family glycosyltransferase [Actinomadura rudentiformis]KAB2346150.1 activator-dependent family glycosyltransferase [Actinomadura rudentiformis]
MRVLFTVYAAKPHFYNLVPMAWALRAAGHEVVVASQPDLVPAITRVGLTAVPVGDPLDLAGSFQASPGDDGPAGGGGWQRLSGVTETRPDKLTWNYVLGTFTIACSMEYEHVTGVSMVDDLVDFARYWQPDLVVWDALTFAGPIAARACGAAHARTLFGIDYLSRMLATYRRLLAEQPPETRDDPVSDWLTGRLARYGLPFEPDMVTELMTGQWTIDPTPGWMQLPLEIPHLPVRYLPFNGSASVPSWVHETPERPRVCFSLGLSGRELVGRDKVAISPDTSADTSAEVAIGDILTALASLDVELVATLTAEQRAAVPDLPANVRAVDFVPLNELLPSCAAIVHHGGFGTVGNVVNHGVPSITIPAPWWDEEALGRLLDERGAGILIDPSEATPAALRDGVARLLAEPSFAVAATGVRSELRAVPTPYEVVPEIARLTAHHQNRQGNQS